MQKSGVGAGKRHQGKTFIRSERVSGMYDGRAGNLRPVRFGSTGIGTDRNGTVRQQPENRGDMFFSPVGLFLGWIYVFSRKKRNERKKAVIILYGPEPAGIAWPGKGSVRQSGRQAVPYRKTEPVCRFAGCRPGGRDMAQKRYDQCPSSPYRLKPESPVSPAATSRKVWPEGISRAIAS